MKVFSCLLASLSLLGLLRAETATPEQLAFFNDEVLPILEEQCFRCHGAEDHVKGEFRITSREGLLHGGELGAGIDLQYPAKSILLQMISYKDENHEMPPKSKLKDAEIATLTKWVESGALYDPAKEIHGELVEHGKFVTEEDFEYWAYKPVSRPEVPSQAAGQHPVDAFLGKRMAEQKVPANDRADRQTLIRRAYYDLIGLPPSPEAVEAFIADSRSDEIVWQELIEDLLDRPQYGEKWARHWLDLVRYAETNGFERDNPKPHIWRYRDYVIQAFNEDKPYDEFIIEQLAGDEIENPTAASLAATGYHRLMQWDDEPADGKQHVYDVLADNVATTSELFLASTLGCARCHDHKADPFSQADFYSFMAFFHGITPYKTEGTLTHWAPEADREKFELERQRRLRDTSAELAAVETELEEWLKANDQLKTGAGPRITTFIDDARGNSPTWEFTTSKPTPDWHTVGFRNKAWTKGKGGFGNPDTPGSIVNSEWKTSDIWMRTSFPLKVLPESLALEIHHDEDVEVYLNGNLIHEAKGHLKDYTVIDLGKDALYALQTGKNVVAVHCHQSKGGQYIDLALRTSAKKAGNLNQALKVGGRQLVADIKESTGKDLVQIRKDLQDKLIQIRKDTIGMPINTVTEYSREPEPMHIHVRGSAHAPGDVVGPAFPGVLEASFEPAPATIPDSYKAQGTSGRRLALAKWIASKDNPLTARVMVNRLWQHHFGRGIVPSTSDFGTLGEDPTHPVLLDWLAAEFMKQDWSIKQMHRLLMTSEAYQRSSAPSEVALNIDPTNLLFWRYNMRRLTAEEIRDSVLAISGNLNLKMGGPEVYPPLPEAVMATSSRPGKGWPTTKGDDAFRRSIYVHVKRSLRVPVLVDHDQADTDNACAVRFTTTVPSQALGMLNGEFSNKQAKHFAERIQQEGGDSRESQVRYGLREALQQEPTDAQIAECLHLLNRLETEAGVTQEAELLERFALMTLNLNEFIYLD